MRPAVPSGFQHVRKREVAARRRRSWQARTPALRCLAADWMAHDGSLAKGKGKLVFRLALILAFSPREKETRWGATLASPKLWRVKRCFWALPDKVRSQLMPAQRRLCRLPDGERHAKITRVMWSLASCTDAWQRPSARQPRGDGGGIDAAGAVQGYPLGARRGEHPFPIVAAKKIHRLIRPGEMTAFDQRGAAEVPVNRSGGCAQVLGDTIFCPVKTSASMRLGVTSAARGSRSRWSAATPGACKSRRPLVEMMTGSTTSGRARAAGRRRPLRARWRPRKASLFWRRTGGSRRPPRPIAPAPCGASTVPGRRRIGGFAP